MFVRTPSRRSIARLKPAAAVVLVHGLLAWLLVAGLSFEPLARFGEELKLFDVVEPPPPPEEARPSEAPSEAEEGAAAPPALKAEPTPVIAPVPVVPVESMPIPAAPVAGQGAAPSAGAAPVPGPGTGAGGSGTGTGAGSGGGGTGAGGVVTRARLVRGRIRDSDYPPGALRRREEGEVLARLRIAADGSVGDCSIERSSGHPELDEITCRLIQRRFRFEPARDAQGNRVADTGGWVQRWWLERD